VLNNIDELSNYEYDFVNFGGVLQYIKTLGDSGKLEAFMQQHDKPRASIGQITFTIARKQLSA